LLASKKYPTHFEKILSVTLFISDVLALKKHRNSPVILKTLSESRLD
jgi:hypothetical protein